MRGQAKSAGKLRCASGSSAMAYVGCRTTRERNARGDGLRAYEIKDGVWHYRQTVQTLANPSYLALNSSADVLYTVHGDLGQVSAFSIGGDGRLALLNTAETGGRNPVHLSVDESGRFLIVANYATGTVASLPISNDGSLGALCNLLQLPGTPGPHRTEQSSSHPHQVLADPRGNRFIVPDKGLDTIFIVKLDPDAGRLSIEFAVPAVREGSGPRHAAFHPSSDVLYVTNELDSTVTTFCRDESRGLQPIEIVSTLPPASLKMSRAAAIAVSPSARWVFVSNRGDDSVACFRVADNSFVLRSEYWVEAGGSTPRFIGFHDRMLLVANERSDTIVQFSLDDVSGSLSRTGSVIATGSPVCVVVRHERASLAPQET